MLDLIDIAYFFTINNILKITQLQVIFIFLLGFMVYETNVNHIKNPGSEVKKSYKTNIFTGLFNDVLISLTPLGAIWLLMDDLNNWTHPLSEHCFTRGILALILMDFMMYYWHRLRHEYDFLWFMHKVHHSDTAINTSTAFRLHIFEVGLTILLKIFVILVSGVSKDFYIINETLFILFSIGHHANIKLPNEELLSKLIITPGLHRTHHSTIRSEHDSNYGEIFSFWDRVFGTLVETVPKRNGLVDIKGMNFGELLAYGFLPEKQPIKQPVYTQEQIAHMIAEAAYYNAKNRGFTHGDDQYDWFRAEQEIKSQYA